MTAKNEYKVSRLFCGIYPKKDPFIRVRNRLTFATHQALIGSGPADFTCTNSSCFPKVRKIHLRGAGKACSAVCAGIGSGLPTA